MLLSLLHPFLVLMRNDAHHWLKVHATLDSLHSLLLDDLQYLLRLSRPKTLSIPSAIKTLTVASAGGA